jgi:hypothetical protein
MLVCKDNNERERTGQMDREEIIELFQEDADQSVKSSDGKFRVARFGALVIWDDQGEMWDEEFLSEAGAIDAVEQQREEVE